MFSYLLVLQLQPGQAPHPLFRQEPTRWAGPTETGVFKETTASVRASPRAPPALRSSVATPSQYPDSLSLQVLRAAISHCSSHQSLSKLPQLLWMCQLQSQCQTLHFHNCRGSIYLTILIDILIYGQYIYFLICFMTFYFINLCVFFYFSVDFLWKHHYQL